MRAARTIELDPGARDPRPVTVHELRLRDVRMILSRLSGEQLKRPIKELAEENLPDLLALAAESLDLPAGTALEDLSLSECEAVGAAWWEIHQGFFARWGALVSAAARLPASGAPRPSSAPRSSAPSAATPPSGTTAGASG